MKLAQRQILSLLSLPEPSDYSRGMTRTEWKEVNRISASWASAATDRRISDYFLEFELSERDFLMLLCTRNKEIIELALQIWALQGNYSLNPEDKYSILLGVYYNYPRLWYNLLQHFGLRDIDDSSQILGKINFKRVYLPRAKQPQRKRGYTDQGTMKSQEDSIRLHCLTDFSREQFNAEINRNREIQDTIDFISGWIS